MTVRRRFSLQSTQGGAVAQDGEIPVGERVRELRKARRMTLLSVAQRAGISEGYLSQVERGIANPSIATLRQIAGALGLRVGDLFADQGGGRARVLRVADRPGLEFGVLGRKYRLTPRPARNVEVFIGEFDPGGSTGDDPYTHGKSEEFVLVLKGRVELQLDGEAIELAAGDSADYSSATPHRLVETGGAPASVLWVISPPSY
ncbi:XRE family transcriptional regulator [Saccharopolyspora thermophila]|uniref:XRE family transcriptional regulator n=1 Tax=Saccharopolyspora thermophila TaxID=89367 RepID=A0ABN1BQ07_9PSEU